MELVQNNRSFEGEQRIYSFESKILKNQPDLASFCRHKLWKAKIVQLCSI